MAKYYWVLSLSTIFLATDVSRTVSILRLPSHRIFKVRGQMYLLSLTHLFTIIFLASMAGPRLRLAMTEISSAGLGICLTEYRGPGTQRVLGGTRMGFSQ